MIIFNINFIFNFICLKSALIALNGLQSNAASLEKAKLVKQEEKLPAMLLCLQRVGLKVSYVIILIHIFINLTDLKFGLYLDRRY